MFFEEAYFANIFYLPLPRHRVGLMFLLMVYDGQDKLIFFYNLTSITMKLNSYLIRDLRKIIEKTQWLIFGRLYLVKTLPPKTHASFQK